MPPGHYYSPVPSLDEVRAREAQIFGPPPATLQGVDLNEEEQWGLLDALAPYVGSSPSGRRRRAGQRYCFDNLYYSHYDAVFLYAMIRHLRPRRIVEIGSGHSSCVILDTNDLHFAGAIACTFVEAHPEALLALIRERARAGGDRRPPAPGRGRRALRGARGERLPDRRFHPRVEDERRRDPAFFNVLPRLHAGVRVHVHNVFFPFEYPRAWVLEGRAWNEAYLLRAFLQYNAAFRIELFNTFLDATNRERFLAAAPLCAASYPEEASGCVRCRSGGIRRASACGSRRTRLARPQGARACDGGRAPVVPSGRRPAH